MLNIGKWFGYNYESNLAVNPATINIPTQDEIRSQLRDPIEKKPDAYKNSQSSSVRFLQIANLTAK